MDLTRIVGHRTINRPAELLGRQIALRTLQPRRTKERGHRTEEFERRRSPVPSTSYEPSSNYDGRPSAGSVGAADNVPLLQEGRDEVDQFPDRVLSPQKDIQGPFSNILKKLRSTPQSQIEDGCDSGADRTVSVGRRQTIRYPPNLVSNAKYTPWSFLPRTLYHEFKFFLNMYFLLVALSQIVPALRIGVLLTYVAPLAFVITIALGKEAYDDVTRRRRDAEANSERYIVLDLDILSHKPKKKAKRGHQVNGSHRPSVGEEERALQGDGVGHFDSSRGGSKNIK